MVKLDFEREEIKNEYNEKALKTDYSATFSN